MLPFIIGIIMALGGLYLIYRAVVNLKKAKDVAFWPSTTGKITKLTLDGLGPKVVGAKGLYEYRRYIVSLLYTFNVNGEAYTGKNFFFGSDVTVTQDVEKICAQFKEGDEVKVYYNQSNPADAVLMTKNPLKKHGDLWMGAVVVVVGLGLIVIYAPAVMDL